MKSLKIFVLSVLVMAGTAGSLSAAGYGRNHRQNRNNADCINSYPKANLTQAQKNDLLFMYEEEKMARDLYQYLYSQWKINTFNNIQQSEQRHMDAVKSLLLKYDIAIPQKKPGEFMNTDIQKLYSQLKKSGEKSASEALLVGKKVEETDIHDLNKRLKNVPEDIKIVYENLKRGSQNHLRAFTRNSSR